VNAANELTTLRAGELGVAAGAGKLELVEEEEDLGGTGG